MIKTYRGKLADGDQDRISLRTIKGEVGYRIKKFQIMIDGYGSNRGSFVQLWKRKQTSVSTGEPDLDFTDGDLLATGTQIYASSTLILSTQVIIFDSEVFNQDIYVTHSERSGGGTCNYYLELEAMKLNENETTMTTLQSLRLAAETSAHL
jgi:hypothetical protein